MAPLVRCQDGARFARCLAWSDTLLHGPRTNVHCRFHPTAVLALPTQRLRLTPAGQDWDPSELCAFGISFATNSWELHHCSTTETHGALNRPVLGGQSVGLLNIPHCPFPRVLSSPTFPPSTPEHPQRSWQGVAETAQAHPLAGVGLAEWLYQRQYRL